ncbi:hypothetical protein BC831DRAFT_189145 [Entophlyctis helioformis]|nr:hypothetical protein BC831DRAFT_189145 [Entophlyctis helioformis]
MDPNVLILSGIFPDADDSLIESVLDAHDGDLYQSQAYLARHFEANETAAGALRPRELSFTAATMAASAQLNALSAQYPSMDASVLQSVLDAHDGNMEDTHAYLASKGHVMHFRKMVRGDQGSVEGSAEGSAGLRATADDDANEDLNNPFSDRAAITAADRVRIRRTSSVCCCCQPLACHRSCDFCEHSQHRLPSTCIFCCCVALVHALSAFHPLFVRLGQT